MKLISEVTALVSQEPKRENKIQILRSNDSHALRQVLKYALHPGCKFYTSTVPTYKPDDSPTGLASTNLHNEWRMLYALLDPAQEVILTKGIVTKPHKKQQVFVQMLEAMDRNDSALLASMITRQFTKLTTINKSLVDDAFPGLLQS